MKNFEIVTADEEAILKRLDDDLFYREVERGELESYEGLESQSDVDEYVRSALERALNTTLPKQSGWYNGSKGRR